MLWLNQNLNKSFMTNLFCVYNDVLLCESQNVLISYLCISNWSMLIEYKHIAYYIIILYILVVVLLFIDWYIKSIN